MWQETLWQVLEAQDCYNNRRELGAIQQVLSCMLKASTSIQRTQWKEITLDKTYSVPASKKAMINNNKMSSSFLKLNYFYVQNSLCGHMKPESARLTISAISAKVFKSRNYRTMNPFSAVQLSKKVVPA